MKTKRRRRGEGAVYQRADGQWCASISQGYDVSGKRQRRMIYGKTKQEVQDQLLESQTHAARGALVKPNAITIAQFLTSWLEDKVKPSVRVPTYLHHCWAAGHIIEHLGQSRLQNVTPAAIQGLQGEMARHGKGVSTRKDIHVLLKRALKHAVRLHLIHQNPCDVLDAPRVPRKEMKVWSAEEARRFLDVIRSERLYALYLLALTTGLRRGELIGLQWGDIDFQRNRLSVRRVAAQAGSKMLIGEPKTASSRRNIDLPVVTVQALREHRKAMLAEGHPGPWVFPGVTGKLMFGCALWRNFRVLTLKAGVPIIRAHDLRHTAATLLLEMGEPAKVVQERLGHSNISMTLDHYAHVTPGMQRQAATKLDGLFAQPEGGAVHSHRAE